MTGEDLEVFYTTAHQYLEGALDDQSEREFLLMLREHEDFRLRFETLQIEKYLNGDMSGEVQLRFKSEIRTNELLKEKLEWQRELNEKLKDSENGKLRIELKGYYPRVTQEEIEAFDDIGIDDRGPIRLRKVLAVAAGVLLIVLAGWYLWPTVPDSAQLYSEFFEPYPMLLGSRGEAQDANAVDLDAAIQAYLSGDYMHAAFGFEKLNDDPQYKLYAAISYLASDQPQHAIPLFKDLENHQSLGEQSEWYLALAYLRGGDTPNAIKTLGQIESVANHAYRGVAGDLQHKIKSLD